MSEAYTHSAKDVAALNHRVAEAEMRATAAADALAALLKTETDPTKTEQRLNEMINRLLILRRQLAELLLPEATSDLLSGSP